MPVLRAPAGLVAAAFFLATFAPPSLSRPAPAASTIEIRFAPVALDADNPDRRRLGRLRFLEGWSLTSASPLFGGISAMHIHGRDVLAVGDSGLAIRFRLPESTDRAKAEVVAFDGPGVAGQKIDRDSESLAVAGGKVWIGFETRNEIWRYSLDRLKGESRAAPASMARWPRNTGPEGLVRLPDGRFLIFCEGARNAEGATEVLLFEGDPADGAAKTVGLRYRAPQGYSPTDAALLPDGSLLVLNRRFKMLEGVSAKLERVPLPRLEADTLLDGEELADFRPPISVDNMEALSVTREQGRTIVWIASDDNFNPLQRTLLLKFALSPDDREAAVRPRPASPSSRSRASGGEPSG